jgi:peptidoglycan/LPS O-acetylase OafA/YrhL
MNYKRFLLITMIASLVVCALVGIYIFIFGDWDETEMKVFGTTQIVAWFSLMGFCCSIHQNNPKLRWFSITGVIAAIIAFILSVYALWWELDEEGIQWKVTFITVILSFALAHMSLMLLVKPGSALTRYSLMTTLALILTVAALLINAVICEFDLSENFIKIIGVFAILDVLGTITTPLLNKLKLK